MNSQLVLPLEWPETTCRKITFILDTASKLEQRLLLKSISESASTSNTEYDTTILDLSDEDVSTRKQSLEYLLDSSEDILLAPVRIAWLPQENASGNSSLWKTILFGHPGQPSWYRARYMTNKHPECIQLVSGKPDTLSSLTARLTARLERTPETSELTDFIAFQAGIALDIAERQFKGSRYKMPRDVAGRIKARPAYTAAVREIADEQQLPMAKAMADAARYMKEMFSRPDPFYIDLYAKINNLILGLSYKKQLAYDKKSIEKLRQVVRQHPSTLLWTHKTYLDAAVVPKLMYDNDFPMPHLFSGANMNFGPSGYIGQRSGAIYIRRSFRDNPIYKLTLRHYITYLMEKRFPLTWSFEGTRSRVGKLMPPKYGLLKYVVEACHANNTKNLHIIPMTISFDMIRDVEDYTNEQRGRIKPPESVSWFMGYLSSLRKPRGRVYVDIGDPIVLETAPDPSDDLALSKVAFQVAVEANRVTPITFPSLISMCLLASAPVAQTEEELGQTIDKWLNWAKARNIRITSDFDSDNTESLLNILQIMIREKLLIRYDQGMDIVYSIAPDQHPIASYYRNSIIHFFVNKAILELSFLKALESDSEDREPLFWAETENLRDLFKFEFFYPSKDEFRQELIEELDLSLPDWREKLADPKTRPADILDNMQPLAAHGALTIFVEAYSTFVDVILRTDAQQEIDEKSCIAAALKYGRQAYLQRRISSEASIAKLLFSNAYKLLSNRGFIKDDRRDVLDQLQQQAHELQQIWFRIDLIRTFSQRQTASNQVTRNKT